MIKVFEDICILLIKKDHALVKLEIPEQNITLGPTTQGIMKSKFLILLLACFLFTCSQNTSTELQLDERISRIENGLMPRLQVKGQEVATFNIEERLEELGIPGLSMAFVTNGKIEWARSYGMADIGENRPMTTETLLLAGSISKPVAALRAHQLVEEGKFDLDQDINNYLTSWKLPDNEFTQKEKVTIRRILNHTAGLTVWGFPGYDKGDDIPSVPDVLDGKGNTGEVRVYKEPGESWMYSGGGYTIMQLAITDTEKTSFPQTMREHVLDPLDMSQSTFENPLPEKWHSKAATGYRGNGDEVEGKWPIYPEMAAAGLWTTPSQLIQYAIEIQKIYQTKKDGILKSSTVDEMLVAGMNGHGLGPGIDENSFGHGGADEGFRAQLKAWKNQPHALVIMVNSDNGQIIQEVALAVAKEYNLTDINPDVREVIKLPSEDLEKYTGEYQVGDLGVAKCKVEDEHLILEAPFINPTVHILAESETVFFDRLDGTRITFKVVDGKVPGFRVQGIDATRIE